MIRAGLLERQQDDPNRVTRTNKNNNNHKSACDDDDLDHEPVDKWLERPWVDAGSMRNNNNATAAAYRLVDNSIERPFLTLKPIKKKRKVLPEFQRVDMPSSSSDDGDSDSDDDTSNTDKSDDPLGGKEKKGSDDGSSSSSDDDEDDEE
mmetsp:Transcript_14002/g.33613  ORF Transcript_14002/g.33613 Transcript_14002/m.33613 type:complete len:149 (-) Transcript_14002:280-726(-)